ncbi:MAG: c-type cytochrome [Thiobacillus sp.]
MKGNIFWVMFATASLLGCGKSEEAAVSPSIQDVPQQVEQAPVESSQVEPAPAQISEPVAAEVVTPPTQPSVVAPPAPAKSTQPIATKPLQAAPASPAAPITAEAAPVAPKPDLAHGQQIYRQSCAVCHDKGIAGAPKLGDATTWSARLAQGMDALYASSLRGKGAMPAKGGNPSLADADVKAAVDFMAAQSR